MIAVLPTIQATRPTGFNRNAPSIRHAPLQRGPKPSRVAAQPVLERIVFDIAEAAPGTVDAPIGAIVIGAVVVTALSFLVSSGLKSGTEAAEQMQSRDKKKWNKND